MEYNPAYESRSSVNSMAGEQESESTYEKLSSFTINPPAIYQAPNVAADVKDQERETQRYDYTFCTKDSKVM